MAKKKSMKPRPVVEQSADSLLSLLLCCLIGGLITVRMLVPTESAEQGSTLWIVQFWLAAGLLWAWNAFRERDGRIRWNRCDAAFWVVVAGHVVSGAVVLLGEGNKRAAINLTWEWVGLGVACFLLRQTLPTVALARRLVGMMVIVSVTLAALGLWQHYIVYPSILREYEQKQGELIQLSELSAPTSRDEGYRRVGKLRELQRWMMQNGIPQDETARALFENRLRSSEPFGMFALANTFAGVLLVWFLAAIGGIAFLWRSRPDWRKLIAPLAAVALIGFCLILTKSRTAWVGLAAGLGVWVCSCFFGAGERRTRWLIRLTGGGAVVVAMFAVAAISGGFDLEVITEAPKSLIYRLQYWTGSWNVLLERPIFGTGPGNFRSLYLKHKLPASSEEIADPHNFVLDLWANGGLLALFGFAAFSCFVVHRAWKRRDQPQATSTKPASDMNSVSGRWSTLTIGCLLAFPFLFAITYLAGQGLDLRLPALLAGTIGLMFLLGPVSNNWTATTVWLLVAFVGILTHLMGAGGIEMPAIVQTLLILAVVIAAVDGDELPQTERSTPLSPGIWAIGALFTMLFVTCFLTATAPVLNRSALVSSGDAMMAAGRGMDKARQDYEAAAVVDAFSPIPHQRLADLYFARWSSLPGDTTRDFDRAVQLQQIAIELDPHSAGRFHTLGKWYRVRYSRTQDIKDALAATTALGKAAARYPNNATIRADLSLALQAAGKTKDAVMEANAALKQDEINQAEGHRDKLLDPQVVESLQEIVRGGTEVSQQN